MVFHILPMLAIVADQPGIQKKKRENSARSTVAAIADRAREEKQALLRAIAAKVTHASYTESPASLEYGAWTDDKAVFLVTTPIAFGDVQLSCGIHDVLARHVGMSLNSTASATGRYAQHAGQERREGTPREGDIWATLVDKITERSCGVFLWVIVVIRSLQDGLYKGNTIHELRVRLNELPSDLKDLYDHMIRNLEPRYRQQASELFQLLLKANEVQTSGTYPLLLQVAFTNETSEQITSAPTKPLSEHDCQERCTDTNNRIRSRSCGLIESRQVRANRIDIKTKKEVSVDCVDFIHRTVVEFLRLPEVWSEMIGFTATPKYDPYPQLFGSCVMMCKTMPRVRGIEPEINVLWHMMDRALIYTSMAEDSGKPVPIAHLEELDKVMISQWNNILKCFSRLGKCDIDGHWAKGYTVDPLRQHMLTPNDFASVALFHGLVNFLGKNIEDENKIKGMNTTQLLVNATRYIGAPPWDDSKTRSRGSLTSEAALDIDRRSKLRPRWAGIAIKLLQADADPNARINGAVSAWSVMLSYVALAGKPHIKPVLHREVERKGFANDFTRLLAEYIKHGADLSLSAAPDGPGARETIDQVFSQESGTLEEIDPWMNQPSVLYSAQIMKLKAYFRRLMKVDDSLP